MGAPGQHRWTVLVVGASTFARERGEGKNVENILNNEVDMQLC